MSDLTKETKCVRCANGDTRTADGFHLMSTGKYKRCADLPPYDQPAPPSSKRSLLGDVLAFLKTQQCAEEIALAALRKFGEGYLDGEPMKAFNERVDLIARIESSAVETTDCKDCEQFIEERDRAQDALQNTHLALGGDGEWVGRLPPCPAPDSGDLHLDVPELARERVAELERLRTGVVETMSRVYNRLQCADVPRDLWHEEVSQWLISGSPPIPPEEPTTQRPRSLAEEVHTLGRQQPSKLHDAGSSPAVDATFDGCPACAGAPDAKHVCSAQNGNGDGK